MDKFVVVYKNEILKFRAKESVCKTLVHFMKESMSYDTEVIEDVSAVNLQEFTSKVKVKNNLGIPTKIGTQGTYFNQIIYASIQIWSNVQDISGRQKFVNEIKELRDVLKQAKFDTYDKENLPYFDFVTQKASYGTFKKVFDTFNKFSLEFDPTAVLDYQREFLAEGLLEDEAWKCAFIAAYNDIPYSIIGELKTSCQLILFYTLCYTEEDNEVIEKFGDYSIEGLKNARQIITTKGFNTTLEINFKFE